MQVEYDSLELGSMRAKLGAEQLRRVAHGYECLSKETGQSGDSGR